MAEKRFLICGGCGFIGSNFTHLLFSRYPTASVTVLDLLTYAGSLENLGELASNPQVNFFKADISKLASIEHIFKDRYDLVINFAAESHVDRSLYYPTRFVETNVLGVSNLLSLCRRSGSAFLQISTDEVYGPASGQICFDENAPLSPTSPYAASKAASDLIVLSGIKTFRQEAVIVRTTNNYGPRQFPEKLIPYFIYLARENKPLPVYGDGSNRRCWFYVTDFCQALLQLIDDFPAGKTFNIGSVVEVSNLEIVELIRNQLSSKSEINFVPDRPAHDYRYRIDSAAFENRFGPIHNRDLESGIKETIAWYLNNQSIFDKLDSADSKEFLNINYK